MNYRLAIFKEENERICDYLLAFSNKPNLSVGDRVLVKTPTKKGRVTQLVEIPSEPFKTDPESEYDKWNGKFLWIVHTSLIRTYDENEGSRFCVRLHELMYQCGGRFWGAKYQGRAELIPQEVISSLLEDGWIV